MYPIHGATLFHFGPLQPAQKSPKIGGGLTRQHYCLPQFPGSILIGPHIKLNQWELRPFEGCATDFSNSGQALIGGVVAAPGP